MSAIVYIPNHADLAEARLPEQYKGKSKLTALVRAFGTQAQSLEDVFFDVLSNSGVVAAHDALLDQLGEIVGQPRNGMGDTQYKAYIFAKITQNISKGTPEVLIGLFKALTQAERVYYVPVYPAGFSLTAIGGTPVGSVTSPPFSFSDDSDPDGEGFGDATDSNAGGYLSSAGRYSAETKAAIKAALNASRIAGVSIDFFSSVLGSPFSFSDDPDLTGAGFGDATDSTVGGTLAEIL